MDLPIFDVLIARLAGASVQSLLLVALVWALCRFWPRLPAATQCVLWWLASLQLLVGLLWPAPFELAWLPAEPARVHAIAAVTPATLDALPRAMDVANSAASPARAASTSNVPPSMPWTALLAWLWLTGVVMTSLQSLHAFQQARRWRRHAHPCTDARVLAMYRRVAGELGVRMLPPLHMSDDIASPQLLGPWNPVVLLPRSAIDQFSENDLDMALRHELSHHARRDLWWGWLPALARHVFFFHPSAYLIQREYAFAREAACDDAVLSTPHLDAHEYGRLLLRLGVAPRPCAGLASASPTFTLLKRRLVMLQMSGSKPHVLTLAIVAALVTLAALPYRVVAGTDPTPRATPAPATHAVAAAAATPAAKAAPAARASTATNARTRAVTRVSGGGDYSYVLMNGDHVTANADSDDFDASRAARGAGSEPMLWVRQGDRAFVIRDAATLQRAEALWKPVNALGEQQAVLGRQQAELGSRQAALGQQMAQLGGRMADIGKEHAKLATRHVALATAEGADADRQRAALDREASGLDTRQKELGRQQSVLGDQQIGLGSKQSALGEKQAALGERQEAESERAHRQMQVLIRDAITAGTAKPVSR